MSLSIILIKNVLSLRLDCAGRKLVIVGAIIEGIMLFTLRMGEVDVIDNDGCQ